MQYRRLQTLLVLQRSVQVTDLSFRPCRSRPAHREGQRHRRDVPLVPEGVTNRPGPTDLKIVPSTEGGLFLQGPPFFTVDGHNPGINSQ